MNVVVFGGSGFIGRNLQVERPDWEYPSSSLVDLTINAQVYKYLMANRPDVVVNLASNVGGIKYNKNASASVMMHDNYSMMYNVMSSCDILSIPCLTMSSTCAWPRKDATKYPLGGDYLDGKPEPSNAYYAYGKRMGMIMSEGYDKSEIMVLSNVYGPRDHFFSEDSHFIPALISRAYSTSGDILELWGVPNTMRQMVYVFDVVDAIISKVEKENIGDHDISYVLGQNETINNIAHRIVELSEFYFNKSLKLEYNGKYPGIPRKDIQVHNSNSMWVRANKLTDIKKGIEDTFIWFMENEVDSEE